MKSMTPITQCLSDSRSNPIETFEKAYPVNMSVAQKSLESSGVSETATFRADSKKLSCT